MRWRDSWTLALGWVMGLRLGLGALMAGVWWLMRPYLNLSSADWRRLWGELPIYPNVFLEGLLGVWPRWDAVHYLNLAIRGYAGGDQVGDTVFYPMFVVLTRGVTAVVGGDYVVGSLFVSSAAAVVALAILHQLAGRHYGPASARWAVTALALYPTAFFLLAPFTESLFLAFTLGAFWEAENKRWLRAGAWAALAGLTRGPALLTGVALAWLVVSQWRAALPAERRTLSWWWPRGVGIGASLLGGGAFLLWRHQLGFPPIPEILRAHSGLEMLDPVRGTYYALRQWLAVHDLPTTLDVVSGGLLLGALLAMLRYPRWRRGEWVAYVAINLAFLLSKHSFVASSWQSLARYALSLFPCFILLGDVLSRAAPLYQRLYLLLTATGLLTLSALYALWWFIG